MKTFCIFLVAFVIIGCNNAEHYQNAQNPAVPPVTRHEPQNPIDFELVNWQPYSKKVDTSSSIYKEFSTVFHQEESHKKRIVIASSGASELEEKLKMALHCSGVFLVMDRDIPEIHDASAQIENLAKSLYAQYLVVIAKDSSRFSLYNLYDHDLLEESPLREENILETAGGIARRVSSEQWQGVTAYQVADDKAVISGGTLDGLKAGDVLTAPPIGGAPEVDIVIEEIQEKYATAKIFGRLEPGRIVVVK